MSLCARERIGGALKATSATRAALNSHVTLRALKDFSVVRRRELQQDTSASEKNINSSIVALNSTCGQRGIY